MTWRRHRWWSRTVWIQPVREGPGYAVPCECDRWERLQYLLLDSLEWLLHRP